MTAMRAQGSRAIGSGSLARPGLAVMRDAERGAAQAAAQTRMIRKLSAGKYRLYSRKKNLRAGKRRDLGTFGTKAAAAKHEHDVQYFKRH